MSHAGVRGAEVYETPAQLVSQQLQQQQQFTFLYPQPQCPQSSSLPAQRRHIYKSIVHAYILKEGLRKV